MTIPRNYTFQPKMVLGNLNRFNLKPVAVETVDPNKTRPKSVHLWPTTQNSMNKI